jgi:hypothetical protein
MIARMKVCASRCSRALSRVCFLSSQANYNQSLKYAVLHSPRSNIALQVSPHHVFVFRASLEGQTKASDRFSTICFPCCVPVRLSITHRLHPPQLASNQRANARNATMRNATRYDPYSCVVCPAIKHRAQAAGPRRKKRKLENGKSLCVVGFDFWELSPFSGFRSMLWLLSFDPQARSIQ